VDVVVTPEMGDGSPDWRGDVDKQWPSGLEVDYVRVYTNSR
jgi:hypothetical protein